MKTEIQVLAAIYTYFVLLGAAFLASSFLFRTQSNREIARVIGWVVLGIIHLTIANLFFIGLIGHILFPQRN